MGDPYTPACKHLSCTQRWLTAVSDWVRVVCVSDESQLDFHLRVQVNRSGLSDGCISGTWFTQLSWFLWLIIIWFHQEEPLWVSWPKRTTAHLTKLPKIELKNTSNDLMHLLQTLLIYSVKSFHFPWCKSCRRSISNTPLAISGCTDRSSHSRSCTFE